MNNILRAALSLGAITILWLSPVAAFQWAQPGATAASDQKNNKEDLATTARIRKAVMEDKALSMAAHNITIVTRNGTVTLRGTVKSTEEKESLLAKARDIAGGAMVIDWLSIANLN